MAVDPKKLIPGLKGSAQSWPDLLDRHTELWQDYWTPIASAGGSTGVLPLGSVTLAAGSGGADPYTGLFRWLMLANPDNCRVLVTLGYEVSTSTQIRVTVGGASTDVTVSADGWQSIAVTPSGALGSSGERECLIEARDLGGAGGDLVILALNVMLAPASTPTGVQASGWAQASSAAIAYAGASIPSEVVARVLNGPRHLAHSRPVCVASLLDCEGAIRHRWETSLAVWEAQFRVPIMPQPGVQPRYALAAYLSGAGAAMRVEMGGSQTQFTGAGWHVSLDLDPPMPSAGGGIWLPPPLLVRLRATSGTTRLHALQVWRVGQKD